MRKAKKRQQKKWNRRQNRKHNTDTPQRKADTSGGCEKIFFNLQSLTPLLCFVCWLVVTNLQNHNISCSAVQALFQNPFCFSAAFHTTVYTVPSIRACPRGAFLCNRNEVSYYTKKNHCLPAMVLSKSHGQRWIRTTEAICSRFTVCPLWPLGNLPICQHVLTKINYITAQPDMQG